MAGSWTRAVAARAIAMTLAGLWLGACTLDEGASSECENGDETCQRSDGLERCVCPAIYDPVCSKNGRTYGNACEADCAGSPVAYEGECEPEPEPDAGAGCICPAIYDPVCGTDGNTYGNSCEAGCAGVPVAHEDECKDSGCAPTSCMSNAECSGGTICNPSTRQCEPECAIACLVYEPVCGTDGVTYGCGAADAHCHGIEVAYPGECKDSCACTKEYQPVCGVDGQTYGNRCTADCAGVAIAHDGSCADGGCDGDEDCAHGYCDRGVTCAGLNCPPPPPNKCTVCGDGSQLLCLALPLPCPDGQVREVIDSCFGECVDRYSCASASGETCSYERQTYQPGEKFPASDGCNTCTCGSGGSIACTEKACVCDYSAPGRKWVLRSPAQCAAALFACDPGTRPFFNECGCGCEPEPAACRVGGCSGQLCVGPGDPDASTCEWREEYACYRTATCEAQADGRCGWTASDELRSCLESAGTAP